MTITTAALAPVEFAVATTNFPGESCSGDMHLVARVRDGVLIAVIDGLGHGIDAHEAAAAAVAAIRAAPEPPLPVIIDRCYGALSRTRGAVMTLVRIRVDGRLDWLGVGNVEATVVRNDLDSPREHILLRGGIVGLPPRPLLRPSSLVLHNGDLLVAVTDGIRSCFADSADPTQPPDVVARRILNAHARGNDDALVVVATFTGAAP